VVEHLTYDYMIKSLSSPLSLREKKKFCHLLCPGSTVEENSAHNPAIEDSKPTTGTVLEKMENFGLLLCHCGSVVEHLTHNSMNEGSNLATGAGKEKMEKSFMTFILCPGVTVTEYLAQNPKIKGSYDDNGTRR
jgi:hypothetical protein